MSNWVGKAIVGTADYREVMSAAASSVLQRMAGYIAPIGDFTPPPQGFTFSIIKSAKKPLISLDIQDKATVFRLDKGIKLQIYKPDHSNSSITYGYVSVYATFVIFHWKDADSIDFEWAHIEISHRDLIEIQHEDSEKWRNQLNCIENICAIINNTNS